MSRWCCLGTIVMLLWLLAPVARCSWVAFRDTPISDYDAERIHPSEADRDRIKQGEGFFDSLRRSTAYCYELTPLFGQEAWKENLMLSFAAATLVTWLLARITIWRERRG